MGNISLGGKTLNTTDSAEGDAWTQVLCISMSGYRISVWYVPVAV